MNFSRKRLLAFSITIIMMILFSKIFGFSTTNYTPKFGISTEKINFRKAANLNSSSIVTTINKDTNYKILGEIDNFYIAQLQDNKIGLVSKDYTSITDNTNENGYLEYQNLDKFYATTTENIVNLRGGPGTNYSIYKKIKRNEKLEIIGKINDWYLVVTEDNFVGMIREDLISKDDNDNNNQNDSTMPNTSETVLTLINNAREQAGIAPLQIYDLLDSTAKSKAKDMVDNNYFSHDSPTYGSPFNMMKNAGITYRTAGENIAGNPSVEKAVKSWLESETHRENILSNAYNFIGIGIEESDTYGYVIVVMFIGK